MNLTQDEIVFILKTLKESEFDELQLTMGSLSLKARRKGASSLTSTDPVRISPSKPNESETHVPVASDMKVSPGSLEPLLADESCSEEGSVPIRAPTLGTFFRRPTPKDSPFVEVGSLVTEVDTVCLLEVMKVFSTVKAGVRGRIQKICVEDGELVEFGQVLFQVKGLEESHGTD